MRKFASPTDGMESILPSPSALGQAPTQWAAGGRVGDSCQEARDELIAGFAALTTALFFFAWSGFDLVVLLVGAAPLLFGRRLFFQAPTQGWCLFAQIAFVAILVVLVAVRVAALRDGAMSVAAGSDVERWLPLFLSSLIPLWFVISGLLNRMPRHLLVGIIGAAGAALGPLLGLAWRDSLALAAAVLGVVLIVDGGIARSRFCQPA